MEKQEVQKALAGFGNELKDIVATAGKDAVAQTLEEFKGNAIEVLKNEFINQLQSTKEDLVAKLKQEIESTTSISVKARDYLYIVLLNIVETFINNISKQILAK